MPTPAAPPRGLQALFTCCVQADDVDETYMDDVDELYARTVANTFGAAESSRNARRKSAVQFADVGPGEQVRVAPRRQSMLAPPPVVRVRFALLARECRFSLGDSVARSSSPLQGLA